MDPEPRVVVWRRWKLQLAAIGPLMCIFLSERERGRERERERERERLRIYIYIYIHLNST